MDVRKTNGSVEEYDKAKLSRGIHKAYKTAGENASGELRLVVLFD